ncbi:MAG: ATP-binding protein [Aquabacterium sp.]|uniref:sensor histidine kinase n=1 Tax=Aquabacterium sp. TaxID=1872578 RepID=UPI003BB149DE
MKTLALRIYLAVVTVLLLFALLTGWLAKRNLEREIQRFQSEQTQSAQDTRNAAWGELIENSLPGVDSPEALQRDALLDWSERLRLPLALDNPQGRRIATSAQLAERLQRHPDLANRLQSAKLTDGRTLWILRPGGPMPGPHRLPPPESNARDGDTRPSPGWRDEHERRDGREGREGREREMRPPPFVPNEPWLSPLGVILPPAWAGGVPELLIVLVMVFIAVAVGAWPVANHLTRRLKQLRQGVERFGEGQLQHRVEVEGKDEVADVARSFNQAAQRIEELVTSHRSLLANASHELRSPLARMKMAIAMLDDVPPEHANRLKDEIQQDINELNGLVEEVLLASRLDARPTLDLQPVDVLGLLIEEAGRVGAEVDTENLPPALAGTPLQADERLLRRAVRNLLENARRYGRTGTEPAAVEARLRISATQRLEILIDDRGPGVPSDQRERIFEPFYRMPGHAEHAGGVGLGLSLVAQIAQRHGGEVRCEAREGGGGRFVIALPMPAVPDGRGASRRGTQARK